MVQTRSSSFTSSAQDGKSCPSGGASGPCAVACPSSGPAGRMWAPGVSAPLNLSSALKRGTEACVRGCSSWPLAPHEDAGGSSEGKTVGPKASMVPLPKAVGPRCAGYFGLICKPLSPSTVMPSVQRP